MARAVLQLMAEPGFDAAVGSATGLDNPNSRSAVHAHMYVMLHCN